MCLIKNKIFLTVGSLWLGKLCYLELRWHTEVVVTKIAPPLKGEKPSSWVLKEESSPHTGPPFLFPVAAAEANLHSEQQFVSWSWGINYSWGPFSSNICAYIYFKQTQDTKICIYTVDRLRIIIHFPKDLSLNALLQWMNPYVFKMRFDFENIPP